MGHDLFSCFDVWVVKKLQAVYLVDFQITDVSILEFVVDVEVVDVQALQFYQLGLNSLWRAMPSPARESCRVNPNLR